VSDLKKTSNQQTEIPSSIQNPKSKIQNQQALDTVKKHLHEGAA